MKISLLFIISFLLFFISTVSSFSSAAEPEPVLDIDGNVLRTNHYYYILPAKVRGRFRGGGLTLSSIGNDTCPVGVFQELSEQRNGIPLTFSPVKPRYGVVRTSTDLNIQFAYPETCGESPVWRVDNYLDPSVDSFVSIGGVVGNPGPATLGSWFKIQKFGYDYKLVYCPTVCSNCDVICKDVGILYQNGERRLFLNDYPLRVVFKQA
ncbi:kunitz trypsin inhibitor 2-like [Coffea eugenioides]|uniref:Kunitz trypsin inhibitor 5-like n=1 Tax=Coffea arabica TaxID=13443 RepID=A0A6P6X8E0_COFAR|nr:kunitz trypsin inhibitor 2-like [Coffea arabica]XP_027169218.1 kunitz trypsin inhibitor 2-like [Coffea eugenioides]